MTDFEEQLKHILGNCPGMCEKSDCWWTLNTHLIEENKMDEAQAKAIFQLHQQETLKAYQKGRLTEATHTTTYMSVNAFSYDTVLKHTQARIKKIRTNLNNTIKGDK